MADPIPSSDKRKRLLPVKASPFTGTFTRSKSQIYLHRNRSGRSRRDSVRLRSHHNVDLCSYSPPSKKSRRKLPQELHTADGKHDLPSCNSVIDLRSRRVFSPASPIQNECELREENWEKNGCEKGGDGIADGSLCDALKLYGKSPCSRLDVEGIIRNCLDDMIKVCEGNGVVRKLEMEFSSKEVLNSDRGGDRLGVANVREDGNTEKSYAEFSCKDDALQDKYRDFCVGKDDMAGDGIEVCKDGDTVDTELVSLKPSYGTCNADELKRVEGSGISNGVADDLKGQNMQKKNQNGKIERCHEEIAEKGIIKEINATQQKSKSVLNPCYRGKLFKAPGSFSYGRLLPYLMDIAKDSSFLGAPRMNQCPKTEIHLEEKTVMVSHYGETFIDKQPKKEKCDAECPDHRSQTGHHSSDSSDRLNSTSFDCPNLRGQEGNEEICNAQKSDGVLDPIEDSNEERCQTTPPDIGLFFEPPVDKDQDDRTKDVLQSVDYALKKPPNVNFHKNDSIHLLVEERSVSESKDKSVLNRCSQRMLFKTPGSLGYRRLLPFLMGITKDNSWSSGNGGFVQNEKGVEQKITSPPLVFDIRETPKGNSSKESGVECSNTDHNALPNASPNASRIPSDTDAAKVTALEHGSQSPDQVNYQREQDTQVEDAVLATLETALGFENVTPSLSSQSCVDSSFVSIGALSNSDQIPVNGEGNCSVVGFVNHSKLPETESLHQNTPQLEDSANPRIPAVGSQKGILKRTPHGYRGLSSCLNCSSFREDAGRAFEFSRKQIRDAEEVVLYLAKELSYLRDMLERSAEDHAVLSINQVKEACRKATEAEELAKKRLSQMKDDLYVQCRSPCEQRPKVRFSSYVEEKIIPRVDLSN